MRARSLSRVGLLLVVLASALAQGQGMNPLAPLAPTDRDPLGFVGTWVEYWPGVGTHDINAITFQNGQYFVQTTNPRTGPYRIDNVRLEGNVLRFTQYPGGDTVLHYEIRIQDPNTIAARAAGGPQGGDAIVWRRQAAQNPPVNPPFNPPAGKDPLGLAGTWIEYWPGINTHDVNVVTFQNGPYGVQTTHPRTGPYRIENVRLEGNLLKFTQYPGGSAVLQYEVQVQPPDTCAVRVFGGPSGGDNVVWRRQATPDTPLNPPLSPPVNPPVNPAAGGDLVATLKWDTQGTDVDLVIAGPSNQSYKAMQDITSGPGQEICIVRNPAPGDYIIGAIYADSRGGQVTPVTVEVRLGNQPMGTFQAVLQKDGDVKGVHKVTLQGNPAVPPIPVPAQPGNLPPSGDATYGVTRQNPIKVGIPGTPQDQTSIIMAGPRAERAYLDRLRDSQGNPLRYQRRGSVGAGPDGHVLDQYELTGQDGRTYALYLDMYHPEAGYLDAPAPRGMSIQR